MNDSNKREIIIRSDPQLPKKLPYKPSSRAAYTSNSVESIQMNNSAAENKELTAKPPTKERRRLSETQLSTFLGKEIKFSQNATESEGSEFVGTLINNYLENDAIPAPPPKDTGHSTTKHSFFKGKKPHRRELHSKQNSKTGPCVIS